MAKPLIGACLAVLLAAGVGHAGARAPAAPSGHVTTLEPAGASGWQGNEDSQNPFTSVGIIQGGAPTEDADPSAVDAGDLSSAIAGPAAAPQPAVHAPGHPPVKHAIGRLPEPGTWLLLLLGLAMIGFALRGLIAANRRLARLETPEA